MDKEKNKGGRPIKFKSVEELQDKITAYFESCFEYEWKDVILRDDEGNKIVDSRDKIQFVPKKVKVMVNIPTVGGLAVALTTCRQVLLDYGEKEEFSDTLKDAKQFIEACVEEGSLKGTLNPTSAIFNLKNNFNWKDKSEVDTTVSIKEYSFTSNLDDEK